MTLPQRPEGRLSTGRPGLGIHAKSAAPPSGQPAKFAGLSARIWAIQRSAQRLLRATKDIARRDGSMGKAFVYRVAMCHRGTQGAPPVISRHPNGSKAEFQELQTCGSVWHCPVCAGKITSRKREDLNKGMTEWRRRGGDVLLVTYTYSHRKEDTEDDGETQHLRAELEQLTKCMSKYKGRQSYKRIVQRAGSIGAVSVLEVTHGERNGWHPHKHELIFVAPGQLDTIKRLRKAWVRALIEANLAGIEKGMTGAEIFGQVRHLMRHAFQVQDGSYAADYVAKFGMEPATEAGGRWGVASELTKGHAKVGRRLSGRTPFELLRLYTEEGDKRAGFLFRQFAIAFQGKRQLFWSRGLRDNLGLGVEETEEEIAARKDNACTERVRRLTWSEWDAVIATESRFDVLEAAAYGGEEALNLRLAEIRERPRRFSSDYTDVIPYSGKDAWRNAA